MTHLLNLSSTIFTKKKSYLPFFLDLMPHVSCLYMAVHSSRLSRMQSPLVICLDNRDNDAMPCLTMLYLSCRQSWFWLDQTFLIQTNDIHCHIHLSFQHNARWTHMMQQVTLYFNELQPIIDPSHQHFQGINLCVDYNIFTVLFHGANTYSLQCCV